MQEKLHLQSSNIRGKNCRDVLLLRKSNCLLFFLMMGWGGGGCTERVAVQFDLFLRRGKNPQIIHLH
jgi:hypothetical protein